MGQRQHQHFLPKSVLFLPSIILFYISCLYLVLIECGSEPVTICLPFPIDEDDVLNDSEILNSFVKNNQTEIFLARNTSERYQYDDELEQSSNNDRRVGKSWKKSPVYLCKRKARKTEEAVIEPEPKSKPAIGPVYTKKTRPNPGSNSFVRTSRNTEPIEEVVGPLSWLRPETSLRDTEVTSLHEQRGNLNVHPQRRGPGSKSVQKQSASEKVFGATIFAIVITGLGLFFHVVTKLFGQILHKPSSQGFYKRKDDDQEASKKRQDDDELFQRIAKSLYNIHFHFEENGKSRVETAAVEGESSSDMATATNATMHNNGQDKVVEILQRFLEKLTKKE